MTSAWVDIIASPPTETGPIWIGIGSRLALAYWDMDRQPDRFSLDVVPGITWHCPEFGGGLQPSHWMKALQPTPPDPAMSFNDMEALVRKMYGP